MQRDRVAGELAGVPSVLAPLCTSDKDDGGGVLDPVGSAADLYHS
jgi:hypothetical protein